MRTNQSSILIMDLTKWKLMVEFCFSGESNLWVQNCNGVVLMWLVCVKRAYVYIVVHSLFKKRRDNGKQLFWCNHVSLSGTYYVNMRWLKGYPWLSLIKIPRRYPFEESKWNIWLGGKIDVIGCCGLLISLQEQFFGPNFSELVLPLLQSFIG